MKKMQIAALVMLSSMCLLNLQQTKAQDATSGTAELKVHLSNILALTVNTNAEIELSTEADYTTGKIVTVPSQLMVSSNVPYSLTVKASSAMFTGPENDLSTGIITVSLPETGANVVDGTHIPVTLSTTPADLLTGASAAWKKNLDVTYNLNAENVTDFWKKSKGDYITTLTYTISNQ